MNIFAVTYFGVGVLLSIAALPLSKKSGMYEREGYAYWFGFMFFWPLIVYAIAADFCLTIYKKWNSYSSKKEFEKKQR